MRPTSRARLRLGAAFVGFAIIVTELDFALRGAVSFHEWANSHNPPFIILGSQPLSQRLVFYLPAALLALASVVGGIALYRATRGHSRWPWYTSALAPVAALLLVYKPPVGHVQLLHVNDVVLPWAAPMLWGGDWNSALSLALQVAVYVAAAAYVLAIVLAIPRSQAKGQGAAAHLVHSPR